MVMLTLVPVERRSGLIPGMGVVCRYSLILIPTASIITNPRPAELYTYIYIRSIRQFQRHNLPPTSHQHQHNLNQPPYLPNIRSTYKMVNPPGLQEHFSGEGPPLNDRWSDLWNKGTVPWDQGTHNPALEDTLLQHRELVIGDSLFVNDASAQGGKRRKRALVPGCGRGYDVLLLARMGFDAVGLEVSEKAIEEGRRWIGEREREHEHGHGQAGVVGEAGPGQARIILGDFFDDTWVKEIGCQSGFDLIYDFTVCPCISSP